MPNHEQVITDVNATEYFHNAVETALSNQKIAVCGETAVYISNLLTSFIYSERLYDRTPDGMMIKPLAQFYLEAVEAQSREERIRALRRLGDIALFISGLFAQSLYRRTVDIDYYISMGGNAYSYLSGSRSALARDGLQEVFEELSRKFTGLVNVLSEVGEITNMNNCNDVLRLYEIWMHTGNARAAEKLKVLGIHPVATGKSHH